MFLLFYIHNSAHVFFLVAELYKQHIYKNIRTFSKTQFSIFRNIRTIGSRKFGTNRRSNKVSVLGAFCAVFLKLVRVNNTILTKYGMLYLISLLHFVLREALCEVLKGLILCFKVIETNVCMLTQIMSLKYNVFTTVAYIALYLQV